MPPRIPCERQDRRSAGRLSPLNTPCKKSRPEEPHYEESDTRARSNSLMCPEAPASHYSRALGTKKKTDVAGRQRSYFHSLGCGPLGPWVTTANNFAEYAPFYAAANI